MSKVKGEAASSLEYTPGEPLPESLPVEEGDYNLRLKSYGKGGIQGWTAKPGKFPNRRVLFEILDTEDEITGGLKTVRKYITLGPSQLRDTLKLAQAVNYPEKMKLHAVPPKAVKHPLLVQNAEAIDNLLKWIDENEVVMRARLNIEQFQGSDQNNVARFLPPEEGGEAAEVSEESEDSSVFGGEAAEEQSEEPAQEAEEATEAATEEAPEGEEQAEEEFDPLPPEPTPPPAKKAPAKAVPKPAAKPAAKVAPKAVVKPLGMVTVVGKPVSKKKK